MANNFLTCSKSKQTMTDSNSDFASNSVSDSNSDFDSDSNSVLINLGLHYFLYFAFEFF